MKASRKSKNSLLTVAQNLIIGCAILALVVGISYFISSAAQSQPAGEYPPPNQVTGVPTPNGIAYPAPQSQVQPTPIPVFAWPTLGPIDPKSGLPISPSQIAAYATYVYERGQLATRTAQHPQTIPTEPSYPVSSLADLPQAIYGDPMLANNSCVQAKNPGPVIPIKSLTTHVPDYYLIAFSQNNKPCAKVVVTITNGRASVPTLSKALEDVFPEVSAEEAMQDVMQKTGLQVKGQPTLVFGQYQGVPITETNPAWQVMTSDGQAYYVTFYTAIAEGDQQATLTVTILSQAELHPIQ